VKAVAGKSVTLSAGFKNTGTTTWKSYGLRAPDMNIASTGSFKHASWKGDIVTSMVGTVKPGETAYVTFAITAPKTNGTHTAKFQFTANDTGVEDAFVSLPVEVTGGAAEAVNAPKDSSVDDGSQTVAYIDEPTIRVGVLIVDEETDNQVVITSSESDFDVKDIDGNLLAEMKKGQSVTAAWNGKTYTFDRGKGIEKVSSGIRIIPKTANAIMTVSNFDRKVTRGSSFTDNTFRNILELRYNTPNDRTWLINELPMEYYLRGLAETSNISPAEFQKTLITAARTYAFYHWSRATKHKSEFFHVDAWLDQVYKGYGQEARTPNLTAAVDATRGRIVTYQGETAITPYFSRSDGRTRNWSDVWYGTVPWCVGVPVPADVGKKLWGHGVGMSASGALAMANDGQTYDQILKYFYTGIDVTKKWE
jgi:peptidoglycan hydrolase-like amidase